MDVSIIIPTYNRLWCLPRAIKSCRNTVCKTEIIVVDDGSNDGTYDWLQKENDIVVLTQKNQGQTYAINAGTAIAKGKYIRFLDSDDFLEEGIIDRQFEKAKETGAQLIYSKVDNYIENSKKVSKCPDINLWADFVEVQLSNRYGSHFLGMLFHNELIKKTPRRPEFAFREDRMFLLEIGLLEPQLAMVEGNAGYWVQHSGQMQGNYRGLTAQVTNWQHLRIYQRILSELKSQNKLTLPRKEAAGTVLWPLAHWIAKDNINEANEVVKWIYELNPSFIVPEKGILGFFYNKIGFKNTEKILKIRRFFINNDNN